MHRRSTALTVAQQAFTLKELFPNVHAKLKPGRLTWVGDIQPTALSRVYTIQVAYQAGGVPAVKVLKPQLEPRPDAKLPHLYDNGALCLYEAGEWDPSMSIANTILPWTSEWLIHYEIWRATGVWYGGGGSPPIHSPAPISESVDAGPTAVTANVGGP